MDPHVPGDKTTLYLLRHGEPAAQHRPHYYGQLDVPLSERGIQQSHELDERLASIPFCAVYSSDLQRSNYLAEQIAERRDLPVRQLIALRERNFGALQGLTPEQMAVEQRQEFERWSADRVFYRVAGGENYEDLRERVIPAMKELVESFFGRRVAVVTHAGPIRVMIAETLGVGVGGVFNFDVDYASVNVLEFPIGGKPRVRLLNG